MKFFAMLMALALACDSTALAFQTAQSSASQQVQTVEPKAVANVKAQAEKRGLGQKVRVKLRNKTEIKGYVSEIGDTSFQVTDGKSKEATTIAYQDVDKIRRPGLSLGAKIAIVAAVVVGVAVAVSLLQLKASGRVTSFNA
jgi:hypothetical protein